MYIYSVLYMPECAFGCASRSYVYMMLHVSKISDTCRYSMPMKGHTSVDGEDEGGMG